MHFLPRVFWSFRKRHLRSHPSSSPSLLPRGSMDGSPSLKETSSGPVLSSLSLLWPGTLTPPPKVPEWDRGRQPRLKQGSGVRVVSGHTPNPAPPVLAPAWWPWGPWLGWVPEFEGGQQCWPELAWRSHSSPGKAENRRSLCPGVLCKLTHSPPFLVLSSFFSLLSLPSSDLFMSSSSPPLLSKEP